MFESVIGPEIFGLTSGCVREHRRDALVCAGAGVPLVYYFKEDFCNEPAKRRVREERLHPSNDSNKI